MSTDDTDLLRARNYKGHSAAEPQSKTATAEDAEGAEEIG